MDIGWKSVESQKILQNLAISAFGLAWIAAGWQIASGVLKRKQRIDLTDPLFKSLSEPL